MENSLAMAVENIDPVGPMRETQPVNSGMMNGNGMGSGGNGGFGGTGGPNMRPMPQPMRQPKPPMDPAKKKKIILGVSLGVGGVVVAIIAIVVVVILMKVDYSETYRLTKEMEDKVDDISYNYDCENVVDYASSAYTSVTDYAGYVNECTATMSGVDDLLRRLGETAGVKRNSELKGMYESFQTELGKVMPNADELKARLELYNTWHKWAVLVDDIGTSSSDAEIQTAANALIESGNDILKKYGEGWLEKRLAYNQAYRTYYNVSWSDTAAYNAARTAMNNAKTELNDYIAANKPDIQALGGLNFEDTSGMKRAFTNFNNKVVELYEENYDYESGDCVELFGEVICD